MLETSDFAHGSAMWRLSLVMSECSLSGRGQGHVSNFYIVDLEYFATTSRRYTGDIHNSTSSVCIWHLRQWEPSRSRHGWVHIVYHALPPTKSPTSYHRFGQDLSYKWFLHCCVAIGKISIDTTHRAVPQRQLSFLSIVVWPNVTCFADWSTRCHVAFIIIEC